ncbi:dTDP-4-dehydrorhamnose reductase [Roseivivax halodurans JCM 10272]|uniref:dTDP-4-dehydrorhamnose reductase n=1 Tax=Roseivivax halodurans JCM 10272 TaxID=1449350 RepID=X7E4L0_9RHOB|nr:dTDP-4-dehydrorhamnose reductase [Roseivivax halodurans]ETX10979.1 dTDP-4-dehydrorhamnose reductase [Roseivivax halodurans JCM 10272]
MTILVFGRTGQVATELARIGGASVLCMGRDEADLTEPGRCGDIIESGAWDAVINAAAWTAVDAAEEHEAEAQRINADAPGEMARAAARRGIPFVQISTDYVFDGQGDRPFAVDARTAPLGAYGRTKLAGEEAVSEAGGPHVILRTSWVVSAHGKNFVKTMLKLGAERDRLTIVSDQIGGPTAATDIARACLTIAEALRGDPRKTGTYHLSGGPDVSWADFAREIFAQAGLTPEVVDIPSSEFPTPAKRPGNSRMDNSATEAAFGIAQPDWRASLREILTELGARP